VHQLTASPLFKLSLTRLIHFLSTKYTVPFAQETKQKIKIALQENLISNPYIAPISDRLIELGINQYRQYQIDQHNMIFYRVDELNKTITLLLVMDARQSIQKLLSEILLLS